MNIGKIAVMLAVLVLFGTCAYAADCNSGGRYEYLGDGTVQDCRTGLIWLRNATCTDASNGVAPDPNNGSITWYKAMKWAAGLQDGLCSLTDGSAAGDWRLPTKTEWMAMVAYAKQRAYPTGPSLTNGAGSAQWTAGDVFTGVNIIGDYWMSTTLLDYPDDTYAWYVFMGTGFVDAHPKSWTLNAWPVRDGQSESFGSLRIE